LDEKKYRINSRYKELEAISTGPSEFDKGPLIIHPRSSFKQYWDTAVTLAVLFCSFQAPIRAAFTPFDEVVDAELREIDVPEILNLAILLVMELIYVLDIGVGFNLGYIKYGVVVRDRALIRSHYLRSHFVWDLIAALPIIFWPVSVYFRVNCPLGVTNCMPAWLAVLSYYVTLLQLLKIPSGLSRSMFLRDSLSDQFGTTICDMFMLITLFVVLTNFFTCLWFITQAYNPDTDGFNEWSRDGGGKSWLTNQADQGDGLVYNALECWVSFEDICTASDKWVLYINCFYWASNAGDGFDTVQVSRLFRFLSSMFLHLVDLLA